MLLEERRVGVSIRALVFYLDRFARQLAEARKEVLPWYIQEGVIPKGDFLRELRKLKRAQLGLVHIEKQMLEDECLKFSNRTDESQSDLILTIHAERRRSLQSTLEDVYKVFVAKNRHVTKIRVYGYTPNDNPVLLDTEMIRQIEYATVTLNAETGIVNSPELFGKFRTFLNGFR